MINEKVAHLEKMFTEQLGKSLTKKLKEEAPDTEVKFIVTCDDNGCLEISVNGKHGHTIVKTTISSVKVLELTEDELITNLLWLLLSETNKVKGRSVTLTMKTIREQSKTDGDNVLTEVEINKLIHFMGEDADTDDDEEEVSGKNEMREIIKEACDEVNRELELKKIEKLLDEVLTEHDFVTSYLIDQNEDEYCITLKYENRDMFSLRASCYEILKAQAKQMINRNIDITKTLTVCKSMFDKLFEETSFRMSYRINNDEHNVVMMVLNGDEENIFSKPYEIRGKDAKVIRTQLFEDFMGSFIPWSVGTDRISGLVNLIYNSKHNSVKDRRTPEVVTIKSNNNEIYMTMSANVDNKHVAVTATIRNPDISKEILSAFKDIRFDDEHFRNLINAKNFCMNYLETKF